MLTFTQLYTEVYQGLGIPSTDSVSIGLVKRNINNGLKFMKSAAMQYYTRKEVVADLKAGQQYYTFNPDMIRARNVRINNGSLVFPIRTIESENEWNALNIIPSFAVFYPQRWFARGPNEIGIWPTPSTNITGAFIIAYDARLQDMYLDDTVGTSVTVTNKSQTVTSTAGFTANMVGQYLTFTDGSDGQWYKIIGFTDSSHITIENYYPNATQTSSATLIGSCPDIPEEFHMGIQDYAFYRYYKTQRGANAKADNFKEDFLEAQAGYVGTFGDKESSQIILPNNNALLFNPLMVPPINMSQS
ncbi:MAG: hypothetical protein KGL39_39715 [Patescibacteria group bacterium]|nr:hypothetical protein [Patescibacteria group bacterium]